MADSLSRHPRQLEDDDDFIESDFGSVPSIQHGTNGKLLND